MKIGFYIGDATLENGGIAPYALRVLESLHARQTPKNIELVTIGNSEPAKKPRLTTRLRQRTHESYRVLTRRGSISQRLAGLATRPIDHQFAALDLLHVPYQTPPLFDIPYICTMHDVQELHFPEYFTSAEREYRAVHHRRSLESAMRIVVSFDHVKQDLIRFFGCEEEKIRVLPLPYRSCTFKILTEAEADKAERRFSMLAPFFLYPAQTWAHKNHVALIEAFEQASSLLPHPISLVCTGQKNSHFNTISRRIEQSNLREAIHFTGIVQEFELRWLYENCIGVVIPTLYEAGSFPLIEAMSLCAPVICARTTSLPDTIGNREFLFEPNDIPEIGRLMVKLSTDSDFRSRSRLNSKKRIEELSETDVAEHYFCLWSEVLDDLKRNITTRCRRDWGLK